MCMVSWYVTLTVVDSGPLPFCLPSNELELKKLRGELEERSRLVVDKGEILRLEQQKRRAEEDKNAALTQLESR